MSHFGMLRTWVKAAGRSSSSLMMNGFPPKNQAKMPVGAMAV